MLHIDVDLSPEAGLNNLEKLFLQHYEVALGVSAMMRPGHDDKEDMLPSIPRVTKTSIAQVQVHEATEAGNVPFCTLVLLWFEALMALHGQRQQERSRGQPASLFPSSSSSSSLQIPSVQPAAPVTASVSLPPSLALTAADAAALSISAAIGPALYAQLVSAAAAAAGPTARDCTTDSNTSSSSSSSLSLHLADQRRSQARSTAHRNASKQRKAHVLYLATRWSANIAAAYGVADATIKQVVEYAQKIDPGLRKLLEGIHQMCELQMRSRAGASISSTCVTMRIPLESISERFHPHVSSGSGGGSGGGSGCGSASARAGGVAGMILEVLLGEQRGICVMKAAPFAAYAAAATTVDATASGAGGAGGGAGASTEGSSHLQELEEGLRASGTSYSNSYTRIPSSLAEAYEDVSQLSDSTATTAAASSAEGSNLHLYLYLHVRPSASDAALRHVMRHLENGFKFKPSFPTPTPATATATASGGASVVSYLEPAAPFRDHVDSSSDRLLLAMWNMCPLL